MDTTMNRGVNTTDFWTNQKAKSCFSSLQNYKETTQAEQLHNFYGTLMNMDLADFHW